MKKRLVYLLVAIFCFTALAACGKKEENPTTDGSTVNDAKDLLYSMYKDDKTVTAADYSVVSVIKIGDVFYNVTWTTDAGDAIKVTPNTEKKTTLIDVNEQTPVEVAYKLTATISDEKGNTATVSFSHTIPAYKLASWQDYADAAANDSVVCTGVVNGIISKTNGNSSNCIYFQDEVGGYYAYNMSEDPITMGIKLGMTVKVTGIKDIYSGTLEIKNPVVEIVDSSIKEIKPVDYTEIYKKAENLKDKNLVDKQALLVTIKGVEIGKQDIASGYLYFKLDGKESYLRISSSVCPTVKDKDSIISAHGEHTGWIADVTGVICVYDGNFYLTPVDKDCFNYVGLAEKTDAEKVEMEAGNVSFPSKYTAAATVTLPTVGTSYDDVKIEWTISENDAATLADGVLTIELPKKDVSVTLTATFTCGTETKTVEYNFKVEAPADDMTEAEILKKAWELGANESLNGKQVLRGEIVRIDTAYSEEYKNITVTIKVGDKEIQCFRLVGGEDLAVGDVITVTGTIKNYVKNDVSTIEFDSKCTYSKELSVEEAKQLIVIDKAYELGANESMNGTQVLRGEIVRIDTPYSEEYKNITVTIKVGDKEIQCFRLVGGEELAVGDVITVMGTIKNYVKNDVSTIEFDSKCTYSKELTLEEAKDIIVINKAYELGAGEVMNGIQELRGEIVRIDTAYSEEYKNITVTIKVGDKEIQCFRLVGGEDLAVGDVITVTGTIKNYVKNDVSTIEFDSKCTYTK